MHVVRTGCAWRDLAADFPAGETGKHFARWVDTGSLQGGMIGFRTGSATSRADPMVNAGIVDAQTLLAADTVATASHGYDARKKVSG